MLFIALRTTGALVTRYGAESCFIRCFMSCSCYTKCGNGIIGAIQLERTGWRAITRAQLQLCTRVSSFVVDVACMEATTLK